MPRGCVALWSMKSTWMRSRMASFRLDLDRLDTMMEGARALVLNSPGNPTGWTASEAELRAIRDIAQRHGAWLIADEVYSRLVYDGRAAAPSLLDIAEPDDRIIVCNSFSKTWVMTGWRLGWLVVPAGMGDLIVDIVEVVHSGVAPFIQRAGVAAIGDTAAMEGFRVALRDRAGPGEPGAGGAERGTVPAAGRERSMRSWRWTGCATVSTSRRNW